MSISSEVGVYGTVDAKSDSIDHQRMQEEDSLFKEMKIDYSPDNVVDKILEDVFVKFKEKLK